MTDNKRFDWVDFYTELATKLLAYEKNRSALISKIKTVFQHVSLNLPKLEEGGNVVDIDPFTVFGLFNKGISEGNRIKILNEFSKEFDISAPVPTSFDGIPVLNNLSATFYAFGSSRGKHDIDNLWDVFRYAIRFSESYDAEIENKLIKSYDQVLKQLGVRWNITMGLFWIRPFVFLNLDSLNRDFLNKLKTDSEGFKLNLPSFNNVPDGVTYLNLCDDCSKLLSLGIYPFKTFPELSVYAFSESQPEERSKENACISRLSADT